MKTQATKFLWFGNSIPLDKMNFPESSGTSPQKNDGLFYQYHHKPTVEVGWFAWYSLVLQQV